jgi:myxalamid-type polyketide synthase MxaE and MxaD
MQVARWLVEKGARHLVLTSRSGLPDRYAWGEANAESTAGRRIAAVQNLEALGAAVTVVQADATDREQIAGLMESIRRSPTPLRGVFHAAGTVTAQPVATLDAATLQATLQPKVIGSWLLHELTQDMALDYFVLFSSGAAIWGAATLAHYAAANHFLDALAHYRRALGLPALSVNWGWWADGGMATPKIAQAFSQVGVQAMPTAMALTALEYLMGNGTVQKTVAAVEWSLFKPIYTAKRPRPLLDLIETITPEAASTPTPELLNRLVTVDAGERWPLLLGHVRAGVASILGFDTPEAVELEQGFFKMGMNSIMAVQLRIQLEQSLGSSLPSTVAFEYPTVRSLSEYLALQTLAIEIPIPGLSLDSRSAQADEPEVSVGALSTEDLLALFANELAAANRLVERGQP